jgi:hypothetical protein
MQLLGWSRGLPKASQALPYMQQSSVDASFSHLLFLLFACRAAFNPFSEAATQRDPGQSPVTTAAHAAATNGAVRGLAASQASGAGVAPRSGQATAFEALRRARAAMASSVVRDSSHHHAALPPQPSQVQAQEPAPPSQLSQPTASFNPFARQRPVAGSSSQGAQGRSTASLPGTSAPLNPVPAPAASRGGRLTTNPLHSSAGDGRAGSSARVHVQPFGARAAQPVDVIEVLDEDQGSEDHPGQSIPAAAEQSSDDDSGLIIVDDGDEDDGDSEADEEQEASGTDDLEGGSDGEGVSEEEVDADDGLLGMPVPVAANNPDITPLRQLGPQTWLPPVPTDGFVSASELHHLLEHNLQQQQPQQQEAEAEAGHSEGDDDEGVAAMLMSPLAAWGAGAPQEAAVGPRAQPRYTEHRPASLSLQSHPPHITSRHSTGSPGEGVQQAGGRQRGVSRLGSPAHPGGAAVPEHYRVPRDASDRGTDQDEGAGPSSARRRNSRRVTGRQSRRTTADSDTHTPLLRDQTHRPLRLSVPRSPAAMSIVEATPQPPSAVMATPEGNTPTPSPAGYASLEAAFAAAELASPGVQAYTPRVFMRGASVGGDDQQEQGAAGEGGEWGGDSPTSLDYYIASPFYDPGLVGRSAADQDAEEGEMSGQLPPSSPTITTVVADLSLLLAAPPVAPSNDTVTAAHAIARSDAAEVCPGVGQGVRLPRVAVERSPSVLAVSSDEDVEDDRLWPAGAGSRDQNGANQHSKRPGKTFHRGGLLHQRLARLHLAQQQVPGQDATSAAGAGIEAEHAGSLVAGAGAASLPGATAAAIETQAGGGGPANRSMINAMQRPVASASGPSSVRGNVRAVPTAPAAPVGEAGSADRPIELLSSSDDEDDGETGDHGAGLAVSRGRSASATHGSLIQVLAEGRQARSNQGASGASAAVSAAAATAAPGRRMTRSQASQQQQRPVAMPHQGGSTTGSGAEAGAGQRTAWVVPGLRRPSTRR